MDPMDFMDPSSHSTLQNCQTLLFPGKIMGHPPIPGETGHGGASVVRGWRWWTQWHSNATVATANQTGATLRLARRIKSQFGNMMKYEHPQYLDSTYSKHLNAGRVHRVYIGDSDSHRCYCRIAAACTEMIIAEGTKWSAVGLEVTDVTDLKTLFFCKFVYFVWALQYFLLVQRYGRKGGTNLHSMIFVWN